MKTLDKDQMNERTSSAAANGSAPAASDNRKKNKKFGVILAIVLLVGGALGTYFYLHGLHHEETENAQVEANISTVISRVPGYVEEVLVQDNQYVQAGDTLLVLDNRDFLLRVREAEAALAMAQSKLEVARKGIVVGENQASAANAGILAAEANIEAARVRQWRAEKDFQRYENLWKDHSITEQQYEQALAEKQAADRQLTLLENQREIARRQSSTSQAQTHVTNSQVAVAEAAVKQAEAALEEARLNLSYTVLRAKKAGQLGAIEVEPGQLIQAGQALFNIVATDAYWVVANFKETQLNRMQPGQAVDVTLDAFPDHTFKAQLSSFAPATGNTFALLPADNATGNFVKVVQKVPVKIVFSQLDDPFLKKIKPGMNAEVDVHIN